MATVVNGSARSSGVLIAVTLGLLCVMLQGATHRIARDAVAIATGDGNEDDGIRSLL